MKVPWSDDFGTYSAAKRRNRDAGRRRSPLLSRLHASAIAFWPIRQAQPVLGLLEQIPAPHLLARFCRKENAPSGVLFVGHTHASWPPPVSAALAANLCKIGNAHTQK